MITGENIVAKNIGILDHQTKKHFKTIGPIAKITKKKTMNNQETTRPGRRGKEPGQPAGIVVRLPAWLNAALVEYQAGRVHESGVFGNSKEALIIHLLSQVLPGAVQKQGQDEAKTKNT